MPDSSTDLAELIGSRICHDLISPIGAINNGLELLTMSGAGEGPEMELIGESVGSASARIRFFRIAFGAAGDQMVGEAEVNSILHDLYTKSRLTVDWTPTQAQPRSAVRLAFLSILCLETAMPYGGTITAAENGGSWTMTGVADKLMVDDALWSVISREGSTAGLLPAHVQFALLPIIAGDDERHALAHTTQTQVTIKF